MNSRHGNAASETAAVFWHGAADPQPKMTAISTRQRVTRVSVKMMNCVAPSTSPFLTNCDKLSDWSGGLSPVAFPLILQREMKFGAHMSTAGGVWKALQRAKAVKAEVCQIFVKNNMQWFGKPPSPNDLALFATELAMNTFACVFGHAGYLINHRAPASEKRERSIRSLIQETQLARTDCPRWRSRRRQPAPI